MNVADELEIICKNPESCIYLNDYLNRIYRFKKIYEAVNNNY